MVYVVYICFAIPFALMLPLLEGSARRLVAFAILGASIAVSAAEINALLGSFLGLGSLDVALNVAPVLEEAMKAIPVLLYAIWGSDKRSDVLPSAMAVGIGFSVVENSYVLVSSLMSLSAPITIEWALARSLSTSLMHGLCTAAVGYGIAYVKKRRKLFYAGTFALLAASATFHAAFNLFSFMPAPVSFVGLAMPILAYVSYFLLVRIGRGGHIGRSAA